MPWRGPDEPGAFPTLGWVAVEWIEEHLRIPDGPKMGQPFRFYDEQVRHFLHRYRLRPDADPADPADALVYSGSMLVRGQKWGKDPILAADDIFQAFGPCVFDGWDADGEPVGRPHPSPWVFVAALNDKQTANTWLPLKAMVEASELVDLPGVEVNLDMIRLPSGNPIEPLTTTAWGRLGGRFTAGSLTENGLMTETGDTSAGKRSALQFARTIIRSVTGMGGMWIAATNTWDPTELSHAQQIHEAKNSAAYVDARLSRKHVDLNDDAELAGELLYLYGDSAKERGGHVSVPRLVRDCRDTANGESEVRRFFLSEIIAGEEPLCTPERWEALGRGYDHPDHDPLQRGDRITIGFDGSRSRDATVLTACRIRDGRLFHLRTWVPRCMCVDADHQPVDCRNRKVPRTDVDQAVMDLFAVYEVWYLYADPYKWQDYLDVWAARWPKRVVEQPTNVDVRMDAMLERFTTARDADELTHDGDDTLTAHVRNAAIAKGRRKPSKPRVDAHGKLIEHYLKVVKKREGLLIDAAIAALLAYDARGQAVEEGALTKQPPPAPVAVPAAATADPLGLPNLDNIIF